MDFKLYKSRNDWQADKIAMLVLDSPLAGAKAVAERIGATHIEARNGKTLHRVPFAGWIAA